MCLFKMLRCLAKVLVFIAIAAVWGGELYAAPGTNYSPQYRQTLNGGDAVSVSAWQLVIRSSKSDITDLLTNDYVIDGEGYILFPIIGRIKVKGMKASQLEEKLSEKYKPYIKSPIIVVTPLIRVILQGAIIKPGSYWIDPNKSLWELIADAGGPGAGCDLKKIRVEREGRVVIENLLKRFEQGYSLNDINVRSGDQIILPYRRSLRFKDVRDYLTFLMTAVIFYPRVKEGI